MSYNDIEKYFSVNVIKKTFTELSFDKESNASLIVSEKKSYDFDSVNEKIKTSDTIIFKDDKVLFIEFKIGNAIKEKDIRLKATESVISYINYLIDNISQNKICFPNDNFHFYLVYNRNNIDASQVIHFGSLERKFQTQYSNIYSKFKIISQDRFIRIFRL